MEDNEHTCIVRGIETRMVQPCEGPRARAIVCLRLLARARFVHTCVRACLRVGGEREGRLGRSGQESGPQVVSLAWGGWERKQEQEGGLPILSPFLSLSCFFSLPPRHCLLSLSHLSSTSLFMSHRLLLRSLVLLPCSPSPSLVLLHRLSGIGSMGVGWCSGPYLPSTACPRHPAFPCCRRCCVQQRCGGRQR